MEIARNKKALSEAIRALRGQGKTIGLIPTMGALHEGHISLVRIAKEQANAAVATIFVNPAQFGPNEDFEKYPRMEREDLAMLRDAGVALVYLPTAAEMYPEGAATEVHVKGLSEELEGAVRPGHFNGVATIVSKLFIQATPDIAVFGEKDYQQLAVIRTFTRDLDLPVRIVGAPIIREEDGLAMSSRNRYLSFKGRQTAPVLYRVLSETRDALMKGQGMEMVFTRAKKALKSAGFDHVDYIELRDAVSLAPVNDLQKPARLLAAVHLGTTRLIDNLAVEGNGDE
jgi:pantoate--beta-alanine ligase